MVVHHIGWVHADIEQARAFFTAALGPLGYKEIVTMNDLTYGFGTGKSADFWVSSGKDPKGENPKKEVTTGVHIAFTAPSRDVVDQCYAAAMYIDVLLSGRTMADNVFYSEAGGKSNGAPGLRPHYAPTYYGAYFLDPAGNNIEVLHID